VSNGQGHQATEGFRRGTPRDGGAVAGRRDRPKLSTKRVGVAAATAAGFGLLAGPAIAASGWHSFFNGSNPNAAGGVVVHSGGLHHQAWIHAHGHTGTLQGAEFYGKYNSLRDKNVYTHGSATASVPNMNSQGGASWGYAWAWASYADPTYLYAADGWNQWG
jgi:hypothetical protein